jgi:predicted P-loop ATPase
MEKKKKTKKASDEGGGKHKKPWQEVYATPDEIEQFLKDHIYLRRNVVTMRTEWREPSTYDNDGTELWQPMSDWKLNSLWKQMQKEKPVIYDHMRKVVESDCFPDYHPFRYYLEHLPPWDGQDHILAMSVSVSVKGDVEEQMRFYEYLKKWLVAMVAGWVDDREVSHVILIFIGEQGIYKTTWFNYVLPPELRRYFYTKTNSGRMTKDDLLTLAQYGLVCYEELDTMSPRELNQLKSVVTMPSVDERAAYAHFAEHRKHIASFCGTGNNVQFLSDTTGTRRWLPFEVESIMSPRDNPFDYEGIYAQAYALYQQGFQYWFSSQEIRQLSTHNQKFETANDAAELVSYYFAKPSGGNAGEFIPTAIAQQIVSSPGTRVSTVALGRAFSKLGFEGGTVDNCRGYYAVRLNDDERRMRARSLAYGALRDNLQMTDNTDSF